ncbi:hypothetical protein NKJ70_23155 [Mesorhizobium sp. M0092]|uniref:hypothetical protein n=1 Tax=unclassified Mesorhizobium TaxID=325217 RepID=UPI0033391F31
MDDLRDFTLAEFLTDQSTNFKSSLPVAHSSESSNLIRMLTGGKIAVTECDTFTSEKLAYFFYGRPAYRKTYDKPKNWQLPFVLVLKSTCLLNVRRIYPFDSGAYFSGRFPEYLTGFDPKGYELAGQGLPVIDLLIDIFFGTDSDYMHGVAKPVDEVKQRRKLDIRHSEVEALCAMYNRDQLKADDRALAIEIQTNTDVPIKDDLLGIVMPRPYFEDKELKKRLKSVPGLIVKPYDVWPLSTESYMGTIYEEVLKIYRKLGFVNG